MIMVHLPQHTLFALQRAFRKTPHGQLQRLLSKHHRTIFRCSAKRHLSTLSQRQTSVTEHEAAMFLRCHSVSVNQYKGLHRLSSNTWPSYSRVMKYLASVSIPSQRQANDSSGEGEMLRGAVVQSLLEVLSSLFKESIENKRGSSQFLYPSFPKTNAFSELHRTGSKYLLLVRFSSDGFNIGR